MSENDSTEMKYVKAFFDEIIKSPWGSISKSRLESLIFRFMVDSKESEINLDMSDFDLSMKLGAKETTIRNLKRSYYQQLINDEGIGSFAQIIKETEINFDQADTKHSLVSIENSVYFDYIKDRLRQEQSVAVPLFGSTVLRVETRGILEVVSKEAERFANSKGQEESGKTASINAKALDKLLGDSKNEKKKDYWDAFARLIGVKDGAALKEKAISTVLSEFITGAIKAISLAL